MTKTLKFSNNNDGQLYTAVFEKHIGPATPNRCTIHLNGCIIGEATWYKEDGLLDRFPEGEPVEHWQEVCDRIEQDIERILKQWKTIKSSAK